MGEQDRILILGLGNILLGDEGFGVHAIRWLEENYDWPENVRLIDGGALGLLLMGELMECDLAIVLDAALGGESPGAFYRLDEADICACSGLRQSAHQTSFADILVSCDLAGYKPRIIGFAMEPFDMHSIRAGLTADAERKLPEFCKLVCKELKPYCIATRKS